MIGKWIPTLLLACLVAGMARADAGAMDSSLSVRGFGTVGLARSSSDDAEFVRDLSQPVGIKGGQWSGRIDSILGLQANWQATPQIELVGQVVSRLHYDRSHNPELMWAFAKWEPDPRVSLRTGRIGADFMMLADSRLVGYSYLPVRPSGDFFGPLFFSHFDGADVSATSPLGVGVLRGKYFVGKTHEKTSGALGVWDTSGSDVSGVVVDYLVGGWQFRANASRIRFSSDMNTTRYSTPLQIAANFGVPGAQAAAESLHTEDKVSRFLSFGLVYDNGPLQLQVMFNDIRHEAKLYQDSHAGYVLAGYRVGALTPYVGYSRWKSKRRSDLPVVGHVALNNAYLQVMNYGTSVDRSTYSIGARWDFNSQMALKMQWDSVHAQAGNDFSFRNIDPASNGQTDVISISVDFVF